MPCGRCDAAKRPVRAGIVRTPHSTSVPLVVGLLCAFVVYGRWRLAPLRGSARSSLRQPSSARG